jgi:hypothetical protein
VDTPALVAVCFAVANGIDVEKLRNAAKGWVIPIKSSVEV